MDLQHRVIRHFERSMETQKETVYLQSTQIAQAGELLANCLLQGGKVLSCGTGTATGLAQLFAAALIGRYERERPGLPAIALDHDGLLLTAVANDTGPREIYARPIKALGQPGDIFLFICGGRINRSILEGIRAAHDRSMQIVALTGEDGSETTDLLQSSDVEIRVAVHQVVHIQETHLLIVNSLCDLIDTQIFGEET